MPHPPADHRLQALLAEHGHVVRMAIQRAAPRAQAAEIDDIEQETHLRFWRSLQRETAIDRPAAYLYRIAVHATLDAIGRHSARREQSLDGGTEGDWVDDAPSPERDATRRQQVEAVRAAMEQLAANRRRAVGLHLQGYTTTEIATFYGWTEPKARNLVYRGLADLRRHLSAEAADAADAAASRQPAGSTSSRTAKPRPIDRAGHVAI